MIGNRPFAVEACADPPASEAMWAAAAEVFNDAAASAIARGECVVAEPGGRSPTDASEPEVFAAAGARRAPGDWSVYVEAVPAPRRPSWPEPPAGQAGWGVAAPAEAESISMVGELVAEAVSMWAASPLDVVLTYEKQADGPWPPEETPPAVARLLDGMRAEVDELLSTRRLTGALELSARTSVHFNHNTFPLFFTGDLRSRLVLVHQNPHQATNESAEYEGPFEYADFDAYLERHRRSGYYRWELGDDYPSPSDYKESRFLRHWGVVDLVDGGSREAERTNVARSVDQRLQLELIPYGSARFPVDIPIEVLAPHYERTLRAVTAYPRDYVILCGAALDPLLELYVVERDDHRFRLPTSTGVSRVEYRFSNLLLEFHGGVVAVGLAPNYASPGVPMDAYGQACHERYRALGNS